MGDLAGLSIKVSQLLAGSKRAFKQGGTVYVSPAMYDLIRNADEAELRHLLANIRLVEIPDVSFYDMPMTTKPPRG
jgi:hypothetical protein